MRQRFFNRSLCDNILKQKFLAPSHYILKKYLDVTQCESIIKMSSMDDLPKEKNISKLFEQSLQ